MPEPEKTLTPRPYRENRRVNLLLLMKEAGSATELALALETPPSHISAMTRDAPGGRNVGDDLATRAERVFRKPLGWMDEAHDGAPAPQAPVSLAAALSTLGDALAADMPDDIRQDAADLLAKLARRRGEPRHQAELVALLGAFEVAGKVPTQSRERADVDQPMSHRGDEHGPATPQQLGGADHPNPPEIEPNAEGRKWISNSPRTDQQQERQPGDNRKTSTPSGRAGQ